MKMSSSLRQTGIRSGTSIDRQSMSDGVVVRAVWSCALLLAFSVLLGSTPRAEESTQNGNHKPAPAPFAVGERLVYQVRWNPPWYLFFLPTMNAGEAEFRLAQETVFRDKKALTIVFEARSSGAFVKLAGLKLDDRFEFVTDADTFCTFRVSKRIREGKRKRDIDVVYFPEDRRLHIRELDVATRNPEVKRDEFVEDIPACVTDLFSALYSVRGRQFFKGASYRLLIGDNARVKEVEARVEKLETVKTPSGRYKSWKIKTVALLGGLFKGGGQFIFWLSTDERRLPVKFEAKAKVGKVSGKLKEYHPGLASTQTSIENFDQ